MIIAVLSVLVGLLTGFGAVQELVVRGIFDREARPFIIGLAGVAVSVLFLVSGIAMLRKWASVRSWIIVTAISSIVFHVCAALPPQRSVGPVALLVGGGYGLVLLIVALTSGRNKTAAAIG